MEQKQCTGICGKVKDIDQFYFRKDRQIYRPICIDCFGLQQKQRYKKNRTKRLKSRTIYRKNNRKKLNIKSKKYYREHKQEKSDYDKIYYMQNKKRISKRSAKYMNKRYHEDPIFRLKCNISWSINNMLKSNNSSKNNYSILDYLPYTLKQLKRHIEKQFKKYLDNKGKVWMTWENRGIYDKIFWDDNDSSTWTWNLDHIIPHSEFHYKTMNCIEFMECWALKNLRPYPSKQNQHDGATRIRHKQGKK